MAKDKVVVEIKGIGQLQRQYSNADAAIRGAVEAGLFLALSNVMTESKKQAPVRFGTLRNSGFVSLPQTSGNGRRQIVMGYGGPAAAYALAQHEGFFDHPIAGKRKYLEDPLRAAADSLVRDAGRFAARFLKRNPNKPPALPPSIHPTTSRGGGA